MILTITLLCLITPHADNLGPITRHGKPLYHPVIEEELSHVPVVFATVFVRVSTHLYSPYVADSRPCRLTDFYSNRAYINISQNNIMLNYKQKEGPKKLAQSRGRPKLKKIAAD